MTNKLPFIPTPVIQRYLQTLVNFITENKKYGKIENGKINHPAVIETYKEGRERFFQDFEENRKSFLKYLESENIACECEYEKNILFEIPVNEFGKQDPPLVRSVDYPEKFALEILDTQKIITLQKFVEENMESQQEDLSWDPKTGILVFKNQKHKFQKRKGKNYLWVLFGILWEKRKVVGPPKEERKGGGISRNELGATIREHLSVKQKTKTHELNELAKKIKYINDTFRKEEIQIKIMDDNEGNTQMVITW
jgi:hypothetical protein